MIVAHTGLADHGQERLDRADTTRNKSCDRRAGRCGRPDLNDLRVGHHGSTLTA